MKGETIIIRVNKETKDKLVELSENSRRSMSDYLRLLIEDAVKQKIKL